MIRLLTAYTLSECMDLMGELSVEYEKSGVNNLIFCEDRLTLIAERTLVKWTGGTFQSTVSTFARYLKTDGKILGKQGSVMAVGKTIAALQRRGEMKCFTSLAQIGAQAKSAYETLAQFSASCIDGKMLAEAADGLPVCALKNKLSDLAKIYEGYEEFLSSSGYLDEAKYLSLLPEALAADKTLDNTCVFFLCFSSFTAQALRAVEVAAKNAKHVVGIFCHGEEDFYTGQGVESFQKACKRVGQVRIEERGTPLLGEAEVLRKSLFNAESFSQERYASDRVRIFAATDMTSEAEYAAVQIKKCLSEIEGLRYRDIALLVPSVKEYSLSVKKALEDYRIPYFIDEKKSLVAHPVCQFLLSAFACVADNYAPASVHALAGNYFFGDSDEYRNYLLKHANFRGGAKRPIKEEAEGYDLDAARNGRERLLSITEKISKKGTGKGYCAAVRLLLDELDVQKRLDEMCQGLEDLSMKGYLEQFFPALFGVLAEAELLTGENSLKAEEFATLLKEGLEATEISLIPLKMDAVFVGDLCDSRIEKVRVLLALGLTGEVPRAQTDSAFVSDADIARLREIEKQIDPTVQEVNARAKEAAALNLCAFMDRLYLTYPTSVGGEDRAAASEIFQYVHYAFCRGDGSPLFVEKEYAKEDYPYLCSERLPAARKMLCDRRLFESNRLEDRETYSALSEALRRLHLYTEPDQREDVVTDAKALFFDGDAISPTTLETYFSCPYKLLMEKGLHLKERQETEMMAVDSGNFVHAVLELSVKQRGDFSDEERFCQLARETAEKLFASGKYSLDESNLSSVYLKKSLIEESVAAARVVYRQIVGSNFTQITPEKEICTDTVSGKVDRVDSNEKYVRIIDYKTGYVSVAPADYYVGKKLQMQLYMSALQEDKIPVGVFYFPTERAFGKEKEESYKLQGFINGDEEALRCGDREITAEKKSEYFEAQLGKNVSQLVMSGKDFCDFLAYAPLVAQVAREEIAEGNLSPNPYEDACKYCKLGGMCGFNCKTQPVRKEGGASVARIIDIVRKQKEGEDA